MGRPDSRDKKAMTAPTKKIVLKQRTSVEALVYVIMEIVSLTRQVESLSAVLDQAEKVLADVQPQIRGALCIQDVARCLKAIRALKAR